LSYMSSYLSYMSRYDNFLNLRSLQSGDNVRQQVCLLTYADVC
jgi:hypothetical protein